MKETSLQTIIMGPTEEKRKENMKGEGYIAVAARDSKVCEFYR